MDSTSLTKPVDLQGLSLALAKTKADYESKIDTLTENLPHANVIVLTDGIDTDNVTSNIGADVLYDYLSSIDTHCFPVTVIYDNDYYAGSIEYNNRDVITFILFFGDYAYRTNTSPYTTWSPLSNIGADWNETYNYSKQYIQNKPAIRAGEGENSVLIGQIEQDENATVYTLYITGETNATTFTYTTEDTLPTATTLQNGYAVCTIEAATGNSSTVYNKIKSIDFTNNTITLIKKIGVAVTNIQLLIYCKFKNAIDEYSYAEGCNTTATSKYAHAEGSHSFAGALYSHAEGGYTATLGTASHAEGLRTIASGASSHAEGSYTVSNGASAHSEGYYSLAYANYSHAEGCLSRTNTGYGAHAEGNYLFWNGVTLNGEANSLIYTIVEGKRPYIYNANLLIGGYVSSSANFNNNAIKIVDATIENNYLTSIELEKTLNVSSAVSTDYYIIAGSFAFGEGAHAEGRGTYAHGNNAHSEGVQTFAIGNYSHAEGQVTVAAGDAQHVEGKLNIPDTTGTYAHIVGNGTATDSRSNAYTLDWSGNGWYAGKVSAGTVASPANPTAANDLATKAYVDAATAGVSPNLSGLADTNISNPADGQVLKYDSTSSKWVNGDAKELFVITITGNDTNGYTSNKTYEEILEAYNNGKICVVQWQYNSNLALSFTLTVYPNLTSGASAKFVFTNLVSISDGQFTTRSFTITSSDVITFRSNNGYLNEYVRANISSPTDGQVLQYDATNDTWVNATLPTGITETRVNELIAAALAQYGDGDTATYGYTDASEVNY